MLDFDIIQSAAAKQVDTLISVSATARLLHQHLHKAAHPEVRLEMFERRPKIKKKRSTAETDGQQAQTTPHRARWLTILTEASGTNPVLLGYHQKYLAV